MKTFNISVYNPVTQTQYATVQVKALDLAELQDNYIAKQEKKRIWGRPPQWERGEFLTDEQKASLESRERIDDMEGTVTEYLVPAEYEVTITDVTEALAEAERIESEKKAKKEQLALTLASMDPASVKLEELAQLIKDLHGEG